MALAARHGMAFDPFDDVDDLEQEAACSDVGLDQFQPQSVAQAERVAGSLADKHLAALVEEVGKTVGVRPLALKDADEIPF